MSGCHTRDRSSMAPPEHPLTAAPRGAADARPQASTAVGSAHLRARRKGEVARERSSDRRAAGGGTLYVVSTPIGNLEDLTLRAARILREVPIVAAEDTRRTRHLLEHLGASPRLVSLHAHNERARIAPLLDQLRAGTSVALVSDAGTPGIADPGMRLVAAARAAGVRIEPIPGPSAIVAALSVSGLPIDRFRFLGFPPVRSKDRKLWLYDIARSRTETVVFFEAPHRARRTLVDLQNILGKHQIMCARELTKMHEEVLWDTPGGLAARPEPARGELTFVVPPGWGGSNTSDRDVAPTSRPEKIVQTTKKSRRAQARVLAARRGISVNEAYRELERAKNLGE